MKHFARLSGNVRAVLALVLASTLTWYGAAALAGSDFDSVNRLRDMAGLEQLLPDRQLADAAASHAAYLDRHRDPARTAQGISAHSERPGRQGFSGETPADRALAAGYPHRQVLENVSMGYPDTDAAVDGLMSAIYHRLTFLDLSTDRLGVGVGERSRVFVLGRADIAALCENSPPSALFEAPLDCRGQAMQRAWYRDLCADLPDDALFRKAHRVACPDGTRLDADFMAKVCDDPPPAAKFSGRGRYFSPCDNGQRVDATWFLGICAGAEPEAVLPPGSSYYEICEPPRRVRAPWFEDLCENLPEQARYAGSMRYRRPCGAKLDIRVEALDELDAARLDRVPEIVMWPPPDATDMPPAFFIEDPDPLPDREVSGYPVSLQFNPRKVGEVVLHRFELYYLAGDQSLLVTPTRLLDRDSDPNDVLTSHQFALFPLRRLEWGGHYRVEVDVTLDGVARRLSWRFATRGADARLLVARGESQRFVVDQGEDYRLYLPPEPDHPHTTLSVRVEHLHGTQVDMDVIDPNTLDVRVDTRRCDQVRLHFDGGQRVVLVPSGCE